MGNFITAHHHDTSPLDEHCAEPVTLVVGNEVECKARVARALAEASGARTEKVTKAGVRTFTRESSPTPARPVVIDTAPLLTEKDVGRVDTARVWISQNRLRQLFGKLVFVVCVIASTDPSDEINKEPDFARNRFSWLHVLGCIFEKHTQQIMMLVNSEDSTDEASRRIPKLKEILKRDGFKGLDNITFFNLRRDSGSELPATIKCVRKHSAYRGEYEHETTRQKSAVVGPFLLRRVSWSHASDQDKFGPWGPDNIILFGRTGSGKSTLAQMLTSARLNPQHKKLSISSCIRGETKKVNTGDGRGWRVIDTPGLGEPEDDDKSSISTEKARRLIKTYVMLEEGTYTHFFYVWKKARVEDLDERLWNEFKRAFEGIEEGMLKTHMTVVVSDADPEWLHTPENISHLKDHCFKGCESFVTAEFPLTDDDDDYEIRKEAEDLRLESLQELEGDVTNLDRKDACTSVGRWAKDTQRRIANRCADEPITTRAHIRETPAFGPSPANEPQPSDYHTARTYIKVKACLSTIESTLTHSK